MAKPTKSVQNAGQCCCKRYRYASFLKNNLNIDITDDNHQEALGNTDSTPEKSIVGLPIEAPGDSGGGSGGDTDVPGDSGGGSGGDTDVPGDSGGGSGGDTDVPGDSGGGTGIGDTDKPGGSGGGSDKPGTEMSKNVEKGGLTLQTGTYSKDLKRFQFDYKTEGLKSDLDVTAKGLGFSDVNLASQENANSALDFIDRAVSKVSAIRASFGAVQNRLESKVQNTKTIIGNLSSSESRIRDTDTAKQVTELVKTQLLDTVSAKMLINSFSLSENVIDLLQQ
jgi:flagellin-like hook-associated protein FlgL